MGAASVAAGNDLTGESNSASQSLSRRSGLTECTPVSAEIVTAEFAPVWGRTLNRKQICQQHPGCGYYQSALAKLCAMTSNKRPPRLLYRCGRKSEYALRTTIITKKRSERESRLQSDPLFSWTDKPHNERCLSKSTRGKSLQRVENLGNTSAFLMLPVTCFPKITPRQSFRLECAR